MYIRRYYPKGIIAGKTYSDEYFEQLINTYGLDYALYIDTAYYEFVFEDQEEKTNYINDSYYRVMENPRKYLDSLDDLPTFSIHDKIYKEKTKCFTINGESVKKR